jgi:DNA-directed RNA polymerase specialized sigma24 family protein
MFTYRGCLDAEELADQTINRVAKKLREKEYVYSSSPAPIFFGFAKKVLQEYFKRPSPPRIPPADPADSEYAERRDKCWRLCMEELTENHRSLMLEYHREVKQKALIREELARRLGITVGALRIRVSRIQDRLEECKAACLEKTAAEPVMVS